MQSEAHEIIPIVDLTRAAQDFVSEVAGASERRKKTLPSAEGLQTFLLYVRRQGSVPVHQVPGAITVQAVLGNSRISFEDHTYELVPGSLVSIAGGVPHHLAGGPDTDCVLLVTHALQTLPKEAGAS